MPYSLTAKPSKENAVSEDVHLAPSVSNPPSSTTYGGNKDTYHNPTLLANGKEGNVYKVHCTKTSATYALKTAASPATSHNPSIVPYIDSDTLSTFLITPYYPLLTLHYQQRLLHLSDLETTTLLRALLSACAYLSDHDLIHRDIKPQNILIASRSPQPSDKPFDNLNIKLTDFGRCISSSPTNSLDEKKERAGTVIYAAPEAFGTKGIWTPKSDVWSVGVVVLECAVWPLAEGRRPDKKLIGNEPFGENSVFAGGWRGLVSALMEDGMAMMGGVWKMGIGRGEWHWQALEPMLREDWGERVGAKKALRAVEEGVRKDLKNGKA